MTCEDERERAVAGVGRSRPRAWVGRRRRGHVPGVLLVWLCVALVVGVAFVGHHVDGSADELIGGDVPVVLVGSWILAAFLFAVVVIRRIQMIARIEAGSALSLAYDALPLLLNLGWAIAIGAFLTRHWLLGAIGVVLCVQHLGLLVPRFRRRRRPTWTEAASTFDLVIANVFVHNKTPERSARQLVETGADVVIVNESSRRFVELFDALGGREAYPHRITDPDDSGEYAITLASRLPLGPGSGMRDVGPLRCAVAEVDVSDAPVTVVATHLAATLELGGLAVWKEQIELLREFVTALARPLVIAGDFNMTRYRPEYGGLLALGLTDAIDTVGGGLTRSIKVAASGPLAALGPIARVDHVLVSEDVFPLSMRNLRAQGSDHLPCRLRIAIRPTVRERADG